MNKIKHFSYLASVLFMLSACSSDKDKPFVFEDPCMQPMVVGELSEMVHKGTSEKDSSYAAAITNVWTKCEKKKENQEDVTLYTRFLVKRSQAGTEQEVKVPYFVVLADNQDTFFFKKDVIAIAPFDKPQKRALPVMEVTLTFSLPAGHAREDLNLLVGLQVDDQELEKNLNKRKNTPTPSKK